MSKLSLVIPTFNEEKNIRIPLDSAYDIVDEVLIIDGGSSDKTVEIAKSYGSKIKVLSVDNPINFLQNKERGIKYANFEWILQLDADEALTKELKNEIKELISDNNEATKSTAGYYIPRKNWFLGQFLMKGGVYPDAVLRLYKKQGAHFALRDVHENVIVEGATSHTKNAIEHYADPDFERYLTRWNRYTTFESIRLIKSKTKLCFFCYFFGKPLGTFFNIYFRHKGFMDGFPGFIWALFSSVRWWAIYIKARTAKT
jgi:glycosyltransferase involved in cell wall biosynthesis